MSNISSFNFYDANEYCVYRFLNKSLFYKENHIRYCEAIFDRVQCWPPTPAGVEAVQACPDSFEGYQYNSKGNATRQCRIDGQWVSNLTNYNSCVKQSGEEVHLLGIYISGYTLSIICLCSALFIFCHFKTLKCTRNFIHCHLFSALILRSVSVLALFIISQPAEILIPLQIVTMLSKLAHLAIFHWMLIEGLYLFKLIYWTYGLRRLRTRHFAIIGWGIPGILTTSNTITNIVLTPKEVWMKKVDYHTNIPIIIILIMNSIIMLFIIHALVVKLRARRPLGIRRSGKRFDLPRQDSSGFNKTHRMSYQLSRFPIEYRKAMKATLVLMPLLGFYYIIFITHYHPNVKFLFTYLNAVLMSTQGFLVALIYCFLNIEVRKIIRGRLLACREGYTNPTLSFLSRIFLLILCCIYKPIPTTIQNGQRIRSIYHCQGQIQTLRKFSEVDKQNSSITEKNATIIFT